MTAPSPLPRPFWLVCGLCWIASCGGGSSPDEGGRGSESSGEDPGLPVSVPAEASQAPGRLFSSRLPAFGPWWPPLRAQVDPSRPPNLWREESLALLAQGVLEKGLHEWVGGEEETLWAVIGPRTSFPSPLRPHSPRVVRPGPELRLVEGMPEASEEGLLGISGARQRLAPLLAPHRGWSSGGVEVWVDGAELVSETLARTRVFVRIHSLKPERALQTNLRLVADWRLGTERVVLASLVTEHFQEVESAQPLFVDSTPHVLGAAAGAGSWLWAGAHESSERTDNLVPFTDVHLGMHGAAVGDVDGDGLEDLYIARHGGTPNVLLRHQPDGSTQDVASTSQVDFLDDTSGVLIVDLDGDGARDLALGVGTDVVVCWNDGFGHFPDRARLSRASQDKVYSLAAADADGDGDLDLYDTRYFASNYGGGVPTPYHDAHNGAPNSYWCNQGQRTFEEATERVGLNVGNDRFSLVSLWEDVDQDGDLDLYVVNDFGSNNLYRNDGGRFVEAAGALGLGDMAAGMGVSPSDVNGDGLLDLYISNMHTAAGMRVTAHDRFQASAPESVRDHYRGHTRGNSVLIREGAGGYRDGSASSMASPGGWAWGAIHVDMDNDGWDEFAVPNGFLSGPDPRDLASFFWRCVVGVSPLDGVATPAYQNAWAGITRLTQVRGYCWNGNERHYAYLGSPGGRFADLSRISGLGLREDGRVALRVDWDGDGREDLILKNRTAPVLRFMRNQAPDAGNYLAIELSDAGPNTEAVGALVEVHLGSRTLVRRVYAGEGYLAGQSKRLHFGLGDLPRGGAVDRVRVTWPDGQVQEVNDLRSGSLYSWDRRTGHRAVGLASSGWGGAGEALPSAPTIPRASLIALERVPCAALPLPRFDAEGVTVGEYGGGPLLVYLWATWSEASRRGLAELHAARDSFVEVGLRLHALAMDGPREAARVAERMAALYPGGTGGRADRRTFALIELIMQAVLGTYDDVALPLALLVDSDGLLTAVHLGPPDVTSILDQVGRLQAGDSRDAGRWSLALTGGRWLSSGPTRDFTRAIEFLAKERGEEAFAKELQAFVDDR